MTAIRGGMEYVDKSRVKGQGKAGTVFWFVSLREYWEREAPAEAAVSAQAAGRAGIPTRAAAYGMSTA